jgi:hypothetical protein
MGKLRKIKYNNSMKYKVIFALLFLFSQFLYGQAFRNLQWMEEGKVITRATVDNEITLSAETVNIRDNTSVKIAIWEKGDREGSDELVGEFDAVVLRNRVVFNWTVTFREGEIYASRIKADGFSKPQYYFTVQYNETRSQPSNLLDIWAWVRRQITSGGQVMANMGYVLMLADESEIEGTTDADGYIRVDIRVFGEVLFYLTR